MNVDRVSAIIRYSQDTGWVEVGAEGTVDAQEGWQQAQSRLYAELSNQLKELWTGGCKGVDTELSGASTAQAHWCQEHDSAFTRKTGKNGSEWWSHKAPDGSWCREKQKPSTGGVNPVKA